MLTILISIICYSSEATFSGHAMGHFALTISGGRPRAKDFGRLPRAHYRPKIPQARLIRHMPPRRSLTSFLDVARRWPALVDAGRQ